MKKIIILISTTAFLFSCKKQISNSNEENSNDASKSLPSVNTSSVLTKDDGGYPYNSTFRNDCANEDVLVSGTIHFNYTNMANGDINVSASHLTYLNMHGNGVLSGRPYNVVAAGGNVTIYRPENTDEYLPFGNVFITQQNFKIIALGGNVETVSEKVKIITDANGVILHFEESGPVLTCK
jgi:hypothetical protein